MAHALQIDTLAETKRLQDAGLKPELAEAVVDLHSRTITTNLVTKDDLTRVETTLKADITEVRADFKTEIAEVKSDLRIEIAHSSNRTVMTLGGLITLLFAIDKLLPLFGG